MNITIFGTGYVGLVTGACLANVGHHVICIDIDANKVSRLQNGEIPIHEPGLQTLVEQNLAAGRLEFTLDIEKAVHHADIQFIAVGTPPNESGAADLKYVLAVAESIGRTMTAPKIIVVKSTVPVGTCDKVSSKVRDTLSARGTELNFDVVSNPEFLKEGAAILDFQRPDRIVVGTSSDSVRTVMRELYEPFIRNHDRTLYMDVRSAELTKYAANAMLATKISFINEISNLAERLGADIEEVRRGIGADPRIGYHFIYPGIGYGGSCFPKDVQALARTAQEVGYDAPLIAAVEAVNVRQKAVLFEKIALSFGGAAKLAGKRVAIWGLSFKPNTDDMREAPSLALIDALLSAGAQVVAYDPVAMSQANAIYAGHEGFALAPNKYAALDNADILAICTEWQEFRAPNFQEMGSRMSTKLIVDGRNLYTPERLSSDGWAYVSIGRAPSGLASSRSF
ncbi:UDP-glucose dehydrogenase family protein [Devosia riboflavina]